MDEGVTRAATEPAATDLYALRRDPDESARLQRQSIELRSSSAELLDRIALQPGRARSTSACGPSGILELLSAAVTPGGRVVGVDADPLHVAMARELVAGHELPNHEIVAADARMREAQQRDRQGIRYPTGPGN
jgi:hypothetical protein